MIDRNAGWLGLGVGAVVVLGLSVGGTLLGAGPYLVVAGPVVGVLWAVQARPQRGILALALLAPMDGLLIIAPHGSSLAAWKEGLVTLTLAATFVCPPGARAQHRLRLPGWAAGVGALLALSLGSGALVGRVQAETGIRIDFFYVLLAWAIWRCPLGRRGRDQLVTILMFDAVLTASVGILQQAIGISRLHQLGYPYNTVIRTAGSHLRSFSTFSQPFPFAYFLMVAVLVCVPVALDDLRRTRNQVFLALLPVVALGMVTSIVRGAWLGTAVGLLYLAIRRHRAFFAALPFALLALLLLPGSLSSSALSSKSFGERTSNWSQNLTQVIAHPLGHGIGSAGSASLKVAALTANSAAGYQPDNYYFKEVYELGPIGLWLFALFLLAVFRENDRAARLLSGRDSALGLGITAAVLAAAFCSGVATFFEIYPMDLYFWLLIAVAATQDVSLLQADVESPAGTAPDPVRPGPPVLR